MNSEEYYNRIFREGRDMQWNDAPGKKVLLSAFVEMAGDQENRIVDVGCGNGYFVNMVRTSNPVQSYLQTYYACDVSEEAILRASATYEGIQFRKMDASNMQYEDELFDVVLSYGAIEHIQEPMRALQEINRTLKAGGLFLIMVPSLDYYRNDREDEGWYEDLDINKQFQWNFRRDTWQSMFAEAGLCLFPRHESLRYGALKPGVFFFGRKS